jgi:hypothetical protein
MDLRVILLVAGLAVNLAAQTTDDQIILPPPPAVDRSELVPEEKTPAAPLPADTAQKPAAKLLDLEDIIIYGSEHYRITPGDKQARTFLPLHLPQDAKALLLRDNLYDQLPEGNKLFPHLQDHSIANQFLSKCYVSYGAWNTMNAKLILGKQNITVGDQQAVDMFIDLKHDQSSGHEKQYYYYRNENIKGTCLYQIEKNVGTQTYLSIDNDRSNQPNHYTNRLLTDYEFGTLLNAYKGDYGSANINLTYKTGSLKDDSAALDYTSAFVQAKGALRWRNVLSTGSIDYLDYGVKYPPLPGHADSTKKKTNLFTVNLKEEGLAFRKNTIVIDGGLFAALYANYLTGAKVQPVLYPRFDIKYIEYKDWDLSLSFSPELSFTPLKSIYLHNPYINKNVEIAPENKYFDLNIGGEYRYDQGPTITASAGHERLDNFKRYQFNPSDSLYALRVTADSLYASREIMVNKFSAGLKTKEFHHTLGEMFVQITAPRFIGSSRPVPFFPVYKVGVVVSGKWFYNIEHRYYLYQVGRQYWGTTSAQTLPAYTVLDGSITRELNDFFKLYLEGYLTLRKPYRLWAGYTEPLFKIVTGLRYRW